MNNPLDTSLFDRAAQFAIQAHSGTERRAKGFPYIVHPMEAATIVASITNDPELLAAAILHDTVEDTDTTIEQIETLFGPRVARLVLHDTGTKDHSLSWHQRKQLQIDKIASSDRDGMIVALGDDLWSRFHTPGGKSDIHWYYRNLAEALSPLSDTLPYQEFTCLIDNTFGKKS